MKSPPGSIEASRAFCRQTARRAGSNFHASFFLLSRPKREAMEALYAFMRHTDDLGDSPAPVDARRAALARWRAQVQAALGGAAEPIAASVPSPPAEDPFVALLPALIDAVRRFSIPPVHLLAVLDGVAMDLDGRRYETFDELADYCRHVASAVGLACIHIWGFRGEEALEPARKCGVAFQLTNILRDLKEDTARGRLYLPAEDLRQCGYAVAAPPSPPPGAPPSASVSPPQSPRVATRGLCPGESPPQEIATPKFRSTSERSSTLEHAIAHRIADDRFMRLMQLEIGRAMQFYREGGELFALLEPEGRRALGMMTSTYWRLLEEIQRRPDRVLAGPVRLGRWRKLRIAARWLLLPPRRSSLP